MTKPKRTTVRSKDQSASNEAMEGDYLGLGITEIGDRVVGPWSMHDEVLQKAMMSSVDGTDTEKAKKGYETIEKIATSQRKAHKDTLKGFESLDEKAERFFRQAQKSAQNESERAKVRDEYREELNKSREAKKEAHKETTSVFKTAIKVIGYSVGGVALLTVAAYAAASQRK